MDGLKGKRTYIKGQITRFEKFVSTIKDDTSIDELTVRLEKIHQLYKDFVEVEYQMIELSDVVQSDIEIVDAQYYSIVPKLQGAIRKRNVVPPVPNLDQTLNMTQSASSDFRLPRITIPPFNGNFKEWQSFFDLFGSTVHENPNLSPAQKFQLLKGHLKDDALALIRHFPINDANYIEAYQKLCKRYDRKRYIVDSFIQTFFDQPMINQATAQSIARLHDTCDEVIRGLKALGTQAESRDPWLIYIATQKMDPETRQMWKLETTELEYPSIDNLLSVLMKRMDSLQGIKQENRGSRPATKPTQHSKILHTAVAVTCAVCSKDHNLIDCAKFLGLEIHQRREYAKKNSLCYNCLKDNHLVFQCKSRRRCTLCQKKHHDILHLEASATTPELTTCGHANSVSNAILPTVQLDVERRNGDWQRCRALLDSGSQTSFVTEECFQRLGLKKENGRIWIQGLNDVTSGISKGISNIRIKPRFQDDNYRTTATVLIVPKISSYQPSITGLGDLRSLDNMKLADPNFNKDRKIDILLGSDLFFELLYDGKKYIPNSRLIAHNTRLGWVIAGTPMHIEGGKGTPVNLHVDIDSTLRKFWELEEIKEPVPYTDEEKFCLDHYQNTVQRAKDGKYIVGLPFKSSCPNLGNSKMMAIKRLNQTEKKFARNSDFKRQYVEFLDEYRKLGHMEISRGCGGEEYFLPHHGVIKESSSTTKLRVVFDGSAKTLEGNSLNDQLAVGPQVQSTLYELLLRFRTHKIIFTADIEKMYRQIWVNRRDSDYQKIVWRKEPFEELQVYKLLTVTYGTSSSPFLATQTLNQLALDYKEEYPEASEIIKRDFYVDDLMSGTNNLKDAIMMVQDLISVMKKGGFNLRKWASNCDELMRMIPKTHRATSILDIEDGSKAISILGVRYSTTTDCFQFNVQLQDNKLTKRYMLSESSKIFDPLGWLSPTVIKIKIIFQKLWLTGTDWNELLPDPIYQEYAAVRTNLKQLEDIRIKRWLYTDCEIELHGFSDASELAYSAVIYSRVKTKDGYKTNLVTAKTKVAPIKSISIPRLELCAATLLTKLMVSVLEILKSNVIKSYRLWTDSTIVLDWLSSCPRRWQTYVANRASFILQHTNRSHWSHVSSNDNPADCASRGLFPEELLNHELWWKGPYWLEKVEEEWPDQTKLNVELAEAALREQKVKSVVLSNTNEENRDDWLLRLIERCSKFTKVVFTITRILMLFRRKSQIKAAENLELSRFQNEAKIDAFNFVIRRVQLISFPSEINALTNKKPICKNSKLTSLFPFLDKLGLLRVGGRLCNANVTFEMKHPIILPAGHQATRLIIRDEHLRQFHAAQTSLLSTLKQKFHILRCKDQIRAVIGRCVKCVRLKAKQQQQLMGQLPQSRVTYHRPFFSTGVDYAGPLFIKASKLRGAKLIKAYLALFVCMATKAVHLELVSDMTTEAFLAALRRFHARRGICGHIYSDNGTNFVGAQKELQRNLEMVSKDEAILRYITMNNIEWHFIPPAAPNFGGLWEAAIKSTKFYLKRVLGESRLTYEEMLTLLVEIEAILNSRPLCEMSTEDLDPLTPGHLLIGHPINLLPEPNLLPLKESRLSRWQHIQRMVQHFWQRWHKEYILTLQQRHKWKHPTTNPSIGDLVVVMDNDVPPTKWLLGRIMSVVPGQDGLIRVVVIRTKLGEIKRPVTKICILPSGSVEPTAAGCSGSESKKKIID